MRLREVQEILRTSLPILGEEIPTVRLANGTTGYRLTVKSRRREALTRIAAIGVLKPYAEAALRHQVFREVGDDVDMTPETLEGYRRDVNVLVTQGGLLLHALNDTLPDEHPLTVAVEVTAIIVDLKSLADVVSALDTVFSRIDELAVPDIDGIYPTVEDPELPSEGNGTRLQAFDVGSEWLELVPPTVAASFLFMKVLDGAFTIVRELIHVGLERKRYEALGIVVSDMKDSAAFNKKMRNAIARKTAENLAANKWSKSDKEAISRLAAVVNKSATLIQKGVRFFPAYKAPASIKAEFPDAHSLVLPAESGVPQLSEGDDGESPGED